MANIGLPQSFQRIATQCDHRLISNICKRIGKKCKKNNCPRDKRMTKSKTYTKPTKRIKILEMENRKRRV